MASRVTVSDGGADVATVRLDDVSRVYSSPVEQIVAVRAVTLTVRPGELVCLMGPSGCGKSTILNLVAGIDVPTTGTVETHGAVLGELDDARRAAHRLATTGYVFQDHRLLDELTALENVMLPLEVAGVGLDEAADAARRSLSVVGIEELGGRYPDELSGGQKQRVGIARAIVGERRLLLADEATGALDSDTSRSIYELLAHLASDGTTIIAATHDPEAERWATRVVRMRDGGILSDAARTDVSLPVA